MEILYKEFGRLLRKARHDAGLTQKQVAGRVGLTRTSITNIERGSQHISLHQLFLLASAVGVSAELLLPNTTQALEDLVPAGVVSGLRDDAEGREFAARILGKAQPAAKTTTERSAA